MESISDEIRLKLLRQYGNFPIAYSTAFQPGLRYFGDEQGFLAYKKVGRTAFVLADPIADRSRHESLIDAFVAEHGDVVFCQASRNTAEILSSRSFFVNEFGCETIVDLETFSFAGPQRRSYRTASNRMISRGYQVREMSAGEFSPADLKAVSEGWKSTKVTKNRDLRFLARPVALADEPGVRKFFLLNSDGSPEGFAVFDPVYENGRATGYLSATRRWLPGSDPLAAYFIVRTAVETFQAEGVSSFHLGLSPFHRIEDKDFEKNWLARRGFRFLYTNYLSNRFFYPWQNLAKHKASFGGEERQTYYAFNTLPSLPRLLKLIWACRLV
ncbi:DUF2156 domain-containing protein [Hoeflea sp. AS16]|uniref:DUF2156 domain-containing protein n=1 Tax=Hoeflea sp. AS16 TaxID=3135779 RepID=UPI00316F5EBA